MYLLYMTKLNLVLPTMISSPPLHFVPNTNAGGGGSSKISTKVNIPKAFAMKPFFNNTTFYKPHTHSVSAGTVRNSRHTLGKT